MTKLTDNINRLEGIKYSHWDAPNERLVVYYGEANLKEAIHIRVAKYLAGNQLQASVKTITLISGA